MEKEPNNSMYEAATMPSYFPCIKFPGRKQDGYDR